MAENVRNPLEKACDAAGRVLRGTHDSFWDAPECSFNDAFVILDKNLNFVAMNDIAQKLFKRFVGDVMGKNILDVFPDIKKTERYYEYVRVIKTGKPFFADDFAPSSTFGDVRLSVKAFKVGNGLGLVVADLTERKRLEVKFAEAEAKYRALVENSTDGIGISRGGQVIYANKAALEIFGFETLEEIRRGSFIDMVVPEDLPFIQDRIEKRLKGEPVPPRFELRIRRTDGEFREIEVIASEVVLNGEKLVQSIYRDITERRKAEEALHFIRFALDNTDEAMVCVSQDARYIDVNDTFCRSVGYSREELLSMKVHDIDPSYSAQIWSDFWRELKKKGSLTFESCHRKKDGKVFPVEIMVTFFEYKGKEYHCGFARDITERKRAEQLLKESEARFATIFRANPAAIAVTRLSDARLINVNEAWQRVTGYSSTEVIGHTIPELNLWVNPGQRDRIVEMVQKQGRVHDEMQLRHKSGEIRELLMSAELTELNGQNYLLMMAQDITEKKRVEEELKQSEAKFRSVLDSSVDMIYRANLKTGTYDYVSPAAEKIIGYTPEELMALGLMGGRSLAHPDDLERLDQNVIDLVLHGGNGEMPSAVEYRFKHKKLGYRWMCDNCSIVCDGTGEPVAVVGVLRDITERKQLEETLRESEGKYRALVEAAGRVGEGIIIVQDREDGEGIIVFVNDEFCNLSGYSREELLNRTYLEFHSLFDFSQEIVERHRRRKQGEDVPTCYEVKAIRKDGTALFVEIGVSLLPWQGKTATVVYVRDITERRRIENALRASEEGYRELADSIGDVFFAMDGNLRYTYWNRASEELTGIKAIDAIGKSVNEILGDTEQTLRAVEIYRKVLVTQQSQSFINEHNIAGKQYFSEIHAYPSRDGLSVFVKDITRRKQAEEALRESETKFRTVLENSVDVIYQVNLKTGTYDYLSPSTMKMMGYSTEEVMAMSAKDAFSIVHPDDWATVRQHFNRAISSAKPGDRTPPIEYRVKHKESGYRWVSDRGSIISDNAQAPIAIVGAVRDITERKEWEEALRESEERYRALVDTAGLAGEGIMLVERNAEGKAVVAFANETLARMLGYRTEEMTGMPGRELFLPGDRVLLHEKDKRRRKGEKLPSHSGVMALRKDGSLLPIELSMGAMNLQGKPATVVYIRDVTDRKAAEEALKRSEEKYRLHFDAVSDVVYSVDSELKVMSVSPSVERLLGYKPEKLLGRRFTELNLLTPDSLERAIADAARVLKGERVISSEYEFIAKDGKTKFGEVSGAPLYSKDGKVIAIVSVARDVTERKAALEKIQRSEEHFRALTENAMDAIVIVRGDGSIGYGSPSIGRMLGYKLEEVVGPDAFRFAHPDDMPGVMNSFAEVTKEPGAALKIELRIKHKDGSWRVVEAVANNLLDNQAIGGIVVNWRDITERKKAEEERLKHTRRVEALHAIAEAASQTLELEELLNMALGKTLEVMEADLGGIYLMDMLEKELVLRASKGLPEKVIERISVMKLGTKKIQEIQKWAEGSLALEEIFAENVRGYLSKAIEETQIKSYAVVPFFIRGQLQGLIAVGTRNSREFGSADMDLLKAVGNQIGIGAHNAVLYEEVRALIRETLDAQERERERVCLEVHDGVAQTLVAAFQYLQSLEAISPDEKDVKVLIAKATVQVKKAIQESREVINSLQPATLKDLGLVTTLRQEMKRLEQETGLKVDFKADDLRLPGEVETGLYRIIHEAVFNARKHSNTKRLRVRINSVNGSVKVEVKDWGKGFSQSRLDSSKRRGTGLFSIRKRMELMKGACDIKSAPGQGTTVSVEIPFTAAKE